MRPTLIKAKQSIKAFGAFLTLYFNLGSFGPAYGQSTTPNPSDISFKPLDNDVSIKLLKNILGDWTSNTPDPTLGSLFQCLNLAIIAFAVCMFIYFGVAALIASAEDGEIFGRKWGSIWVPVRLTLGMGLLFPMANGLSGVQALVLWMATSGVGVADWATNSTVQNFVKNQGSIVSAQLVDAKSLATLMTSIMQANVCIAEGNHALQGSIPDGVSAYGGPFIDAGTGTNSYGKATFGLNTSLDTSSWTPAQKGLLSNIPEDACGSIEIPNFHSVMGIGNNSGGIASSAISWTSGVIRGTDLGNANTAIRQAHFKAITQAAIDLMPAAQSFVDGQNIADQTGAKRTLAAQIASEAKTYQDSIAKAMSNGAMPTTNDMTQAVIDSVSNNGWAALGTFFYQYARINSELSKMTSYSPKISKRKVPDSASNQVEQSMNTALNAAISQSASSQTTLAQIQTVYAGQSGGNGGLVGSAIDGANSLSNWGSQNIGELFGVDASNKVDSLVQLKHVGDNIISATEVIYLAKSGFSAAAAVAAPEAAVIEPIAAIIPSGGLKAFIGKLASLISGDAWDLAKFVGLFAAFAMIGFGMTLAYWLPMAPFILWLGGVAGWLISVIEMVVAAPLWAAAHMHPEGDGLSSNYGKNGYMIIIEVAAKPLLCVAGFFLASRFLDPFLKFASSMFFSSMTTINADNFSGIVTCVAFVFIYVSFCVALVNRAFTLIHVIPDSVLHWVGSQGSRFADHSLGRELEGGAKGGFEYAKSVVGQGGKANLSNNIIQGAMTKGEKGEKGDQGQKGDQGRI